MGIIDKMEKVNAVMDGIAKISDDYQTLRSSGQYMKEELMSYNNGRRSEQLKTVESIRKKDTRLLRCIAALWAVMFILTIVLCVTGNDVVLRALGV